MIKKNLFALLIASFNTFANENKLVYLNSLIPADTELRERVLTTLYCDDCSYLPRVENAGKIFEDKELNIEYQLMHNGAKVYKNCYYGNWMTTLIELSGGYHEPQEEKLFHEALKLLSSEEPVVMLELGGYWGYYSLWFKKQFSNSSAYLIEPDPKNIVVGKKNFELNNMTATFEEYMISSESLTGQRFIDWDYNEHIVNTINIDDFAEKHNLPFIHILHSDIQGAEVAMLQGCHKLMSEKRIGYYFISTHRGVHEKCLEILKNYDLEIIVSITREESFSADGLILAKLPELPMPLDIEISRRTNDFCSLVKKVAR